MPQLIIKIKDKIAKPLNNCVICDNSDYTVKFIFDEEWEKEPLRIARFIWNKQYVDVQFTGDTCEVPVVSKTNNLAIGVYAGDLRTTTPAILACHMSILSEDVIEHSVTPSEYEEIMKLLNAQATDIAALKAADKRIWTQIDNTDKKASLAQGKANQAYSMADDALTATRTNATNINTLKTDVNALKAADTSLGTRIDNVDSKASAAKTKAEEGVAKADSALARNIFTDEEKTKLANITNPIIIKGRVDTVNDLPTEAVVGWFYFVGLESASSYEEYCYSENGWEYIGLSQEGVDLSNYYTKEQVDTTVNALKAADTSLGTRIDNVDSKASAAKVKAEEGVAKADNALTQASSNATNINSLQTDVNSLNTDVNALRAVDTSLGKRIDNVDTKASTAKTKAEEGVAKADDALTKASSNTTDINSLKTDVNALRAVDTSLSTRIDSVDSKASAAKTKAEEGVAKADNALAATRTNANKIKAHANDIAINRTTLGYQCRNLLPYSKSTVKGGITFTCDKNGYMTASNTAGDVRQWAAYNSQYNVKLKPGKYILSFVSASVCTNAYGNIMVLKANNEKIADIGQTNYYNKTSGAVEFTIDTEQTVYVMSKIFDGKTAIMLRYADITDDTYEPYKETIDERLIENKSNVAVNRSTLGYQCKNLLKNNAVTQTVSGVTFTVNSDGSVTVNGTNTSSSTGANFEICSFKNYGTGKLTASLNSTDSNLYMSVFDKNWVGVGIICDNEITWDNDNKERLVRLVVKPGATINNVTVYPMIRYADIIDGTYEPYSDNVDKRLIKTKSDIAINKSTLGYQCKNLLKNTASTKTVSGITFTVNDDKSVTANGTNSTSNYANIIVFKGELEAGTYTLTGAVSDAFRIRLGVGTTEDGYGSYVGVDRGNGYTFTVAEKALYTVTCQVESGKTASNVIFKPMLRYADIMDDTYEEYKPSLIERCLLKDTAGISLGHAQSSSITIDNLSSYTALWVNVSGGVSGINFATNLIVPVAYLAKSTSNSVQLAGGIPSSAYTTSEGVLAAKYMDGTITAKISGNTLDLTISDGTIGAIEVISLM